MRLIGVILGFFDRLPGYVTYQLILTAKMRGLLVNAREWSVQPLPPRLTLPVFFTIVSKRLTFRVAVNWICEGLSFKKERNLKYIRVKLVGH